MYTNNRKKVWYTQYDMGLFWKSLNAKQQVVNEIPPSVLMLLSAIYKLGWQMFKISWFDYKYDFAENVFELSLKILNKYTTECVSVLKLSSRNHCWTDRQIVTHMSIKMEVIT